MITLVKRYFGKSLIVFFIYLLVGGITFGKLPQTFFQQDEWALFGYFTYWDKAGLSWFERLFTYEHYTHLIPLSDFFSYWQFKLLRLNFSGYALFSISIQIANAFLVYILSRILLKNTIISFIAGLLFLTSSISHQAITWIVTTIGTAGSTLFVLLSLIFLAIYVERKEKLRWVILSFLSLVMALGFKETSIFMFLFIPLSYLLWKGRKALSFKLLFSSGVLLFAYMLFRIIFFFINKTPENAIQALSQPTVFVYLYRLLTLPIKFIVQSIIPQEAIIDLSKTLLALAYPQFVQEGTPDPYIVESVGADIITLGFFILILIIFVSLISFLKKRKEIRLFNTILASFLFIFLSSMPFLIIPGRAGFISLLDGRHLYLSYIFVSIVIATFIYCIYLFSPWKKLSGVIIIVVMCLLVLFNVKSVRRDIHKQAAIASTRQTILQSITGSYPRLPEKVVFYFESDKAYYGLPIEDKILPFQSGFGQTLLVWYNSLGENFPPCFYKEQFLYELLSEGHRECNGRRFGFYRRIETLKSDVLQYKINKNEIIAFRYDSSTNMLSDITSDIKSSL